MKWLNRGRWACLLLLGGCAFDFGTPYSAYPSNANAGDTVESACSPGAIRCIDGRTQQICLATGQWRTHECGGGWVCQQGLCQPLGCTPLARTCGGDGKSPAACDSTGAWNILPVCSGDKPACMNGVCIPESCTTTMKSYCDDGTAVSCGPDGSPTVTPCGNSGCTGGSCGSPSTHCSLTQYQNGDTCSDMFSGCAETCATGSVCDLTTIPASCTPTTCSTTPAWSEFARITALRILDRYASCDFDVTVQQTNSIGQLIAVFDPDTNALIQTAIAEGSLKYLLAAMPLGTGTMGELAWMLEKPNSPVPCRVEEASINRLSPGQVCEATGKFADMNVGDPGLAALAGSGIPLRFPAYGAIDVPLYDAKLQGPLPQPGDWQHAQKLKLCGLIPRMAILAALDRLPASDFAGSLWGGKQQVLGVAIGFIHDGVVENVQTLPVTQTIPGACEIGPRYGQACLTDQECGTKVLCNRHWETFVAEVDFAPATCGGVTW